MEITVAYVDRFGRNREVPVDQVAPVPFEQLAPLQAPVPYPDRQSFVTNAWASATGQSLACGSLRQQHCAMVLDRDETVEMRSAGPMELRWQHDGRPRRLRPDFVARRAGAREVICIQPEEITGDWQTEQAVLARAAEAAGWQARIMQPPVGVELDNLALLYAARNPRALTEADASLLAGRFTTARSIRCGVRASRLPRLAGLDLAYYLVWKRRLDVDMSRPLTPSSTAWLPHQDDGGAVGHNEEGAVG